MIRRRVVPLALAALTATSVACLSATEYSRVPFGFVTIVAQKAGAAYSASTVASFYDATGLGVPSAPVPWDSCRALTYSPSGGISMGQVYPSINAGSAVQVRLGSRTDSLFPQVLGTETQYRIRSGGGIAYTPGDSVSVVIPGTSTGFPAITFRAKTAEPFTMQDISGAVAGARIDLKWSAPQDANSTMVLSLRYSGVGSDTLNSQVYCQFHDDGTDSIPARYAAAWASAGKKAWVASRVRTYIGNVARGGYLDYISTFDLPTPVAP